MNAPQARMVWNKGGWIGSVVGCTTWMVVSGLGTMVSAPLVGTAALLLALGVMLFARALWRRRAELHPIRGIQALSIASLVAAICGISIGIWRGAVSLEQATPLLLSLVVFPLMAGVFEFRKRLEDRATSH